MLLPGIKLGPNKDWREKLETSQAQYVEIWYRVDKPEWYTAIFSELQRRGVTFGLHFWGSTTSSHEANLAYPTGAEESAEMILACLQAGSSWGASYVNIHSGNRVRFKLDLRTSSFEHDTSFPVITSQESEDSRTHQLESLSVQAHRLNIALLVEPIPAKISTGPHYTTGTFSKDLRDQYPTTINSLINQYKNNLVGFTNDFCHLFAYYYAEKEIYNSFISTTKILAPYTYLCHINTLWEPYDGADCHGGILPADLSKPGVFPSKNQLVELFRLYQNLPHDVFLIGEPADRHIENYQALKTLLASL